MSGKIVNIFISKDSQSEMQSVNQVVVEEGKGIFGDRYANKKGFFSKKDIIKPDQEVTLIEKECIDAFNKEFKTSFKNDAFRRNIVVTNCDLNSLIDKEFQVGKVTLKGQRVCEPCAYLSKALNNENLLKGLKGKGGLRAQVIQGGSINLDSQIEI